MTTSKEGKQRKARGMRFERKVRADLEKSGWVVDKWTNNVDLGDLWSNGKRVKCQCHPVMHSAKSFRGITRSNGFPDFIAFRLVETPDGDEFPIKEFYEVIAVESKMNGVLRKIEKEKCQWYLDNNIFSKILIVSKGEQRGEIVYKEFERGLKK